MYQYRSQLWHRRVEQIVHARGSSYAAAKDESAAIVKEAIRLRALQQLEELRVLVAPNIVVHPLQCRHEHAAVRDAPRRFRHECTYHLLLLRTNRRRRHQNLPLDRRVAQPRFGLLQLPQYLQTLSYDAVGAAEHRVRLVDRELP